MLLLLLALPCAALSPEEALGTDALGEALPPDAAAALEGMSPSNVDPEAGLAGIGGLLLGLLFWGVISTFLAMISETAGSWLLANCLPGGDP